MDNELYQLLLSLRLGDGCFVNQRKLSKPTYSVMTNTINQEYVNYKERILNSNNILTKHYTSHSGYGSSKVQYGIRTRVEPEITIVGRMEVEDIIKDLDLFGMCLWYLDDGSLHKTKHFMNLYCNSLTYEQTELVIDRLYEWFPVKRCTHLYDSKKDGRKFGYVYIPKTVAAQFNEHVRKLLVDNHIDSLLYKTIPPSQTIESIV